MPVYICSENQSNKFWSFEIKERMTLARTNRPPAQCLSLSHRVNCAILALLRTFAARARRPVCCTGLQPISRSTAPTLLH
jgi:hypothetical protein